MPNLECPRCGAEVSANDIHCLQCGFNLTEQDYIENEPESHFFSDVLSFPFIPIKSSWQYDDHYREIAARGSLQKLILLPIFNNFVAIMGVYLLVGNNPYIDIGIDPLTFTALATCFFLIIAFLRFLSFRIVSGKGNFVAQGYLDAIVTTDYLLLSCLSIVVLYITRSEELSNLIMIVGGIFLLIPSLISLASVHYLPAMRTFAGFVLSLVPTVPLYLLFLSLLSFIRETGVFEAREWGFFLSVILLLLMTSFVVLYMRHEEKLSENTHEKVPVKESIIAIMQVKKFRYIFLFSVPIYFLISALLILYYKASPVEIYDWRLMLIVTFLLLIVLFVAFYILCWQRLSQDSHERVSIIDPIIAMMRVKKVKFTFLVGFVLFIGFVLLDHRYPSIETERSPFLLTFAPNYEPDLLYIGTRDEENQKPTYVDVLHLSTGEIREVQQVHKPIERMRSGETGDTLILADRNSSHGNAVVIILDEMRWRNADFDYLEDFGINNFPRNEIYFTSSKGGVTVENSETSRRNPEKIEPNIRFYSVANHPNNEIIFLVADNQIKVVNADSLETVDTIRLGGKLRDAAVSPDGERLYVADALWNRIRVIPLPSYNGK